MDVIGEISDAQIEHLRGVLTRQLDQRGLRGQVTTPPRFVLQQSAIPGDLTVRMHLNTDPIDRDDPCRLLRDREPSWEFIPAELLA